MAIQQIPPFAPPLTANTQGTPAIRESEKVDAVAPVIAPDTEAPVPVVADPAAPAQPGSNTPSREQIDQAMSEVKRALAPVARNLQFSVDDATGRTVIKVIDSSTNQVIRQMPSEELLAITKALDSFSGLFVKQKA